MAIYTRTGDAGTTALFTGQRVSKSTPAWKRMARSMSLTRR